jgi:hypothetical protein
VLDSVGRRVLEQQLDPTGALVALAGCGDAREHVAQFRRRDGQAGVGDETREARVIHGGLLVSAEAYRPR